MRYILSVLALVFMVMTPAAAANAQQNTTLNVEGLTPEQISQLSQQVNAAKQQVQNSGFSIEKVNQYAEVGKSIGVGLATAAREMGVAVNEFAGTGVGKVALFLIVYKVAGASILGGLFSTILGVLYFAVVTKIWARYFNKICMVESERTVTAPDGTKTHEVEYLPLHSGDVAGYRLIMLFVLVIVNIPTLVLIF